MDRIDLKRYLSLLRRQWLLIVILIAVVVGVSLVQSLTTPKTYETSSRVILLEQTSRDLLIDVAPRDLERALQVEVRALDNRQLAVDVEAELGVKPDVSFDTEDADVLVITARGSDPELVTLIANTYAERFIESRTADAVLRLETTKTQVQGRLDGIDSDIRELEQALDQNPDDVAATIERQARLEDQAGLNTQLDELDFLIASETGGLILGESAEVPRNPVSPRPVRSALLAGVLGLVLAVTIVLVRDAMDDTIRDSHDLAGIVGPVPVLGLIPPSETSGVDALERPGSASAEAYRALTTAVIATLGARNGMMIQVTSAARGEGKTEVTTNLGVAISQIGLQVAIVDADFRDPGIASRLPDVSERGLSDVLVGDIPLEEAVSFVGERSVVRAVSAGTAQLNPAEMLFGDRVREVLHRVRANHEVTVVDSPGLLGYADANVIAGLVDATLVVVRAGTTKADHLSRVLESLDLIEAEVLGVVLTNASDSVLGGSTGGRRERRRRQEAALPIAPKSTAGPGDEQLTAAIDAAPDEDAGSSTQSGAGAPSR